MLWKESWLNGALVSIVHLKTNLTYSCLLFVLNSDAAMKQLLLHLDETNALGSKFILQDLDETHLFISADILQELQSRIDDLMDRISFPLAEKDID